MTRAKAPVSLVSSNAKAMHPGVVAELRDGGNRTRITTSVPFDSAAHGDVISTGGADHLDERSLPVLGKTIHDAACASRYILDQVGEQTLGKAAMVASKNGLMHGV
ncbi:hypothetical protein [Rhodanobacter sp. C01]|uniref:hypothetical protein n=1 Tax=Rhodanobacter sp. C01 TaxID=1945856 RepID=UPI0020C28727|nr:hypothetical protein [Rhodanobacter sp. C01]